MKPFAQEKLLLPEYFHVKHLPHKANPARDDLVVTEKEAEIIFSSNHVHISEKVDAANCGFCLYENEPIIRNREHILRKGFVKDTPAKKQFASIFNWFYKNKIKFENLNKQLGLCSVYFEWMVQTHGQEYDELPDWAIAFDIYICEERKFLDSFLAHAFLIEAGFDIVPTLKPAKNYEELEILANEKSNFSSCNKREGIFVKISDGKWQTNRFKMVREGFIQGGLFENKKLRKNFIKGTKLIKFKKEEKNYD